MKTNTQPPTHKSTRQHHHPAPDTQVDPSTPTPVLQHTSRPVNTNTLPPTHKSTRQHQHPAPDTQVDPSTPSPSLQHTGRPVNTNTSPPTHKSILNTNIQPPKHRSTNTKPSTNDDPYFRGDVEKYTGAKRWQLENHRHRLDLLISFPRSDSRRPRSLEATLVARAVDPALSVSPPQVMGFHISRKSMMNLV